MLYLVVVCLVLLPVAYVVGRRHGGRLIAREVVSAKAPARYRVVVNGEDAWTGDDSSEASRVISAARAQGARWMLYADGVLKKDGRHGG